MTALATLRVRREGPYAYWQNAGIEAGVSAGATVFSSGDGDSRMVEETERDDMLWYRCEECGLMFDDQGDAEQHEQNCDAEDPSYLQ